MTGGLSGSTCRRGPFLSFLLLFALLLAGSCGRAHRVFPGAPVILISIDTLRADHLPAYGYRSVETPALDALRRDSILFENAISHVPLTLPSHVSLFTGLLPFQHAVRDNLGYRLSKDHTTLATILRRRGYATGGAVSAFVLERTSGVGEGFDFYDDSIEMREVGEPLGRVQRSGWQTATALQDWIEKQPSDHPLFAFLHLYEPHSPYEPPEPFRTRYAARPYDGEIATADAIVGRFLDFVKRRGLYDRAIIVLLSDHGEGLGEHAEDEHGIFLYRTTIRVPLLVKLPGSTGAGGSVGAPVQIADVFPTVLAALGEKSPPGLPGTSLLELVGRKTTPRRVYSETLYPRLHFGWRDLAALTDDRYEYIQAPRSELYDWRADPEQAHDLSGGLPPAFRSLRVALQGMNRPFQAPGARDPETLRKLASLGYIGVASPSLAGTDLPDPKDRIGTIDRLKDSTRLVSQHRDEEAIALLRQLARDNPLMSDVWEALSRTLRRNGRPGEALDALSQVDRLTPASPQVLLALSDLALEARDFRKARSFVNAASTAGASNVHAELAAIALAEGDLPNARKEALSALEQRPTVRQPLLVLARIEQQAGNLAASLAYADRALLLGRDLKQRPLANLQSVRGDVLARMGREREAEEAFRREVGDFPDNLDAWSRLAFLSASEGRLDKFRELLTEMVARVPSRRGFDTAAKLSQTVGDRPGALEWERKKREKFPRTG